MSSDDLREGTVTVMFTDVEGFTAMTTRQGDAAARAMIEAQRRLVRAQVEGHGGREIDQIGDGFMVAFTSTRKAIACALAIQDEVRRHNREHVGEELRIRVGLNVGEVIEEGGHPFGAAVNGAARVAGKARGGQILVSEAVKQVAGKIPDASFRDRGRFQLKGFPDRWRLYEVVFAASADGGARGKETPATRVAGVSAHVRRFWLPVLGTIVIAGAAAAITAMLVNARGGGSGRPSASGDPAESASGIVIGRSIGSARIGMDEGDVREILNQPESIQSWTSRGRSGSTATYYFRGGAFSISYFEGKVVQVATRSPAYATESGIRVGLDAPDPGIPPGLLGSNWKDALVTGELVQTGRGRYVWRGFVYGGEHDYCATGAGTVTMLLLGGGGIAEIRIAKREFVLDRLPLGTEAIGEGAAACNQVL